MQMSPISTLRTCTEAASIRRTPKCSSTKEAVVGRFADEVGRDKVFVATKLF